MNNVAKHKGSVNGLNNNFTHDRGLEKKRKVEVSEQTSGSLVKSQGQEAITTQSSKGLLSTPVLVKQVDQRSKDIEELKNRFRNTSSSKEILQVLEKCRDVDSRENGYAALLGVFAEGFRLKDRNDELHKKKLAFSIMGSLGVDFYDNFAKQLECFICNLPVSGYLSTSSIVMMVEGLLVVPELTKHESGNRVLLELVKQISTRLSSKYFKDFDSIGSISGYVCALGKYSRGHNGKHFVSYYNQALKKAVILVNTANASREEDVHGVMLLLDNIAMRGNFKDEKSSDHHYFDIFLSKANELLKCSKAISNLDYSLFNSVIYKLSKEGVLQKKPLVGSLQVLIANEMLRRVKACTITQDSNEIPEALWQSKFFVSSFRYVNYLFKANVVYNKCFDVILEKFLLLKSAGCHYDTLVLSLADSYVGASYSHDKLGELMKIAKERYFKCTFRSLHYVFSFCVYDYIRRGNFIDDSYLDELEKQVSQELPKSGEEASLKLMVSRYLKLKRGQVLNESSEDIGYYNQEPEARTVINPVFLNRIELCVKGREGLSVETHCKVAREMNVDIVVKDAKGKHLHYINVCPHYYYTGTEMTWKRQLAANMIQKYTGIGLTLVNYSEWIKKGEDMQTRYINDILSKALQG